MNASDAEEFFGEMLDRRMTDDAVSAYLTKIADRGETVDEIVGAARAMRKRMVSLSAPANAIDVCGTGGDGSHSLNVSTAVAIVVAACGVPVAKHGNRAASSKAGAADTLEALGLNLDQASKSAEACLADLGICFLFAPNYHPALGPLSPIRRAIGRRTIFNLLGPMCNPAGVTRQLVGVAHPSMIELYHCSLTDLGSAAALIVSGREGLDEISISGPTAIATIGIDLGAEDIAPEALGFPHHAPDAIRGGDAAFNAKAINRLMMGDRGAYRDAVVLNAAAALVVAQEAATIEHGIEEAAEAIDKGLGKALLDCWITYK